jgi:hypothetical protein
MNYAQFIKPAPIAPSMEEIVIKLGLALKDEWDALYRDANAQFEEERRRHLESFPSVQNVSRPAASKQWRTPCTHVPPRQWDDPSLDHKLFFERIQEDDVLTALLSLYMAQSSIDKDIQKTTDDLNEALRLKETRGLVAAITRLRARKQKAEQAAVQGVQSAENIVLARYNALAPDDKRRVIVGAARQAVEDDWFMPI